MAEDLMRLHEKSTDGKGMARGAYGLKEGFISKKSNLSVWGVVLSDLSIWIHRNYSQLIHLLVVLPIMVPVCQVILPQ